MKDLWVASAGMGYGHQCAVFPFRTLAHTGILNAGDTADISASERKRWKTYLRLYETFSRAKAIPLVGKHLFGMLGQSVHHFLGDHLEIGTGMRQKKHYNANEWLTDLLQNGRYAYMAWLGFLRERKLGMQHIPDVPTTGTFDKSDNPLQR